MKKFQILFMIYFVAITLNAQDTHHSGKITEEQLIFFKENYKWNTQKILIINFLQPKYNCHYDAYKNIKKSKSWWTNLYKEIDLKNIANRFVFSDYSVAKKVIDSETFFLDKEEFILKHFFLNEPYCHGILVINQSGNYEQKSSEYLKEDITEFITRLSN